jgi:hypothetical protein
MTCRTAQKAVAIVALAIGVDPARATWSIIIVDTESKEIGCASATCLAGFNLKRYLPVVRPGLGAGCAQSYVDTTGRNRVLIWDQLGLRTPPATILLMLDDQDNQHQMRQYGIVDTLGQAVTFSGKNNGAYANGLTGRVGRLAYAIQGNVITGQPVLDLARAAIENTPGGIPEKLMAAMEAARSMGGDGRCSCADENPPGCGSPPPSFEKTAHCGFMVVTRRGDSEGTCGRQKSCADGVYYLDFNIKNQGATDPDPVFQMQALFDAHRAARVGVPDAAASTIHVEPDQFLPDGVSTAQVMIEIRDWQGLPATGILNVEVLHDPGDAVYPASAGSCTIEPLIDLGDGVYTTQLTVGTCIGIDRIAVIVTDATGSRYLIPSERVVIRDPRADLNDDQKLDNGDLETLLRSWYLDAGGDVNGDGRTDNADLQLMLDWLAGVSDCL